MAEKVLNWLQRAYSIAGSSGSVSFEAAVAKTPVEDVKSLQLLFDHVVTAQKKAEAEESEKPAPKHGRADETSIFPE